MAGIGVTPSTLAGYSGSGDLIDFIGIEGFCTGWGFYTIAANAAVFANPAFWDKLKDEGFFTGYMPKKYYTPDQAKTIFASVYVLGGVTMRGIEYRLRVEGITVGDFRPGTAAHLPGDEPYTILYNLANEGYYSGVPELANSADPSLTDHDCLDGRMFGSGCIAPDIYELGVSASGLGADGQTYEDSVDILVPYPARVFCWMSYNHINDVNHVQPFSWAAVFKGQVAIGCNIWRDSAQGNSYVEHQSNEHAMSSISANVTTNFRLSAYVQVADGAAVYYKATLLVVRDRTA